jgi:hypothetical protein
MIKHIVCWRLHDRSRPLEENADALAIRSALEAIRDKIPGLLYLELGFDFSDTESAADIVLYTEFESREALEGYQKHLAHVAAGKVVKPRVCDRRMIDYVT